MKIHFNKPYYDGEINFLDATKNATSGNGLYTKKAINSFKDKYSFSSLLTSSCTDALEMCAILSNIKPGDEVILPSYTFVSTANAFILRGAKLIFVDTESNFPNMDVDKIEDLITKNTKAIICVHYGGFSCDMGKLLELKRKYNFILIEDAAQAFDNYYIDDVGNTIPLGSIGDYGTLSFHETKNISCGEGGLLIVNNDQFKRAEIIWEKGTNRTSFYRGEVDKYEWVDIGSSFLMSDITAYILFQNLQVYKKIQKKRVELWNLYNVLLEPLINDGYIENIDYPKYSTKNGHNFFIVLKSEYQLKKLVDFLKNKNINSVTHYRPLHSSKFFMSMYNGEKLINTEKFSSNLLRLPLHYFITKQNVKYTVDCVEKFFKK